MKLIKTGMILALTLALAACPDDPDVPPVDGVDAAPLDEPCLIEGPQGAIAPVGTIGGLSRGNNAAAPYHVEGKGMYTEVTPDLLPDWFAIQLWDLTETFPAVLETGTWTIDGNDLQYDTCGICVMLIGNHSGDAGEEAGSTFLATSGNVTITAIAPTFEVSIENVEFEHVSFSGPNNTISSPNPSGCTASVTSLDFSVPLQHINTLTDDQLKSLEAEGGLAARRIRARRDKNK